MDKKRVIEQLTAYLAEELATLLREAGEGAETLPPELGERAAEIRRQLVMYKFLPARELGPEDVVCAAALVELELSGRRAHYLVVPNGGGLVASVDGQPVQVITPNSPLGEALLGKKAGDHVEIKLGGGGSRSYLVIAVT